MTRNHGKSHREKPKEPKPKEPKPLQLAAPNCDGDQATSEPIVDVLSGRTYPRLTNFDALRPRLLELINEMLDDTELFAQKARDRANGDNGSLFYLDKAISRRSDNVKVLATMAPLNFYAATDPIVNVEVDEAQILRELAAERALDQIESNEYIKVE